MAKKAGARYLDSSIPVQKKTLRGSLSLLLAASAALVAIVGTLFLGTLVAYSSVNSEKPLSTASAEANICAVIGQNMDGRSSWRANWDVTLPELDNRRFALSEVVPNAIWWSHFSGTSSTVTDWAIGKWDKVIEEPNATRSGDTLLPTSEQLPGDLAPYRNFANCTLGTIPGAIGSFGLNFGNFVTKITSFVTTMAFNSSFICSVEPTPGQICIDLLAILGGRGNDAGEGGTGEGASSGIIGNLTSSLYRPLMIIVVLVTALTVAWTGIVKRRFRDAFFQAIWLAASTIIGLALLLNPSMLVKAPMVVGNTIVGCVVGAFNGSGCTGDGGSTSDAVTGTQAQGNVCKVDASTTSLEQKTTLYVSGMSCSIWSAFVLEPYAQGAYGVGLSALDLDSVIDSSSGQTVRQLLEGPGWNPGGTTSTDPGNAEAICVNVQTSESYASMGNVFQGRGETNSGAAGAICNLAVWDLFMKTNAVGGGVETANNNPDNQWFTVMSRLPANTELFHAYVDDGGAWGKMSMGTLSVVASLAGSFLLISVSAMALVYYLVAIIMMAFAPVFFLFGMHPGRGKKIMFGWLEQVISNLLKYIVSAVFLLIAITFYGSILGTSESLIGSLIFIVLITLALWMYRRELLNILSRVDMGGEKMSDAVENFGEYKRLAGEKFGKPARAVAAGAIAGGITGAGVNAGFKAAANRELRQGNSLMARTFQATDALGTDNENDLYKYEKNKRSEANAAQTEAANKEKEAATELDRVEPMVQAVENSRAELNNAQLKVGELDDVARDKLELDSKVQVEFANGDFAGRRAERVDSNGVSSSAAYKNVAENAANLRNHNEAMKSIDPKVEPQKFAEAQSIQVELKAKYDDSLKQFKQEHGSRGIANAYAELQFAENNKRGLELEADKAEAAGDLTKATAIRGVISEQEISINTQKASIKNIYGEGEFKLAADAYKKTEESYVKHLPADEDSERFTRAHATSQEELTKARQLAVDNVSVLGAAAETAGAKLDKELERVQSKVEEASRARTDAAYKKAEVDYISEEREKLNPGDIVKVKDVERIKEAAQSVAGIKGGREAEFGDNLEKKINDLQERSGSVLISPKPETKGDAYAEAVERYGKNIPEVDRKEANERIKAEAEAINRANLEKVNATREVENARRAQESDKRVRELNESLALKDSELSTASQERAAAADNLRRAQEARNVIGDSETPAGVAARRRADAELAEAKSNLSSAERNVATASADRRNISNEIDEQLSSRVLKAAEAKAEALNERAKADAEARGSRIQIPSTIQNDPTVDPRIMDRLTAMTNASANADLEKLSAREQAQLAEVQRRIEGLSQTPTPATLRDIEKLMPREVKSEARVETPLPQPRQETPVAAPAPRPTELPTQRPEPRQETPAPQPRTTEQAPRPAAAPAPRPTEAPRSEPQRPAPEQAAPAPRPEPRQQSREQARPAPEAQSQPERPTRAPAPKQESQKSAPAAERPKRNPKAPSGLGQALGNRRQQPPADPANGDNRNPGDIKPPKNPGR